MIAAVAPIVAMQMIPTPAPIASPTPAPVSERSVLSDRLDTLVARVNAQTGGTLGAVIWDLGTGAKAQSNAQMAAPMAGLRKLPLAVLAYAALDADAQRSEPLRELVTRMLQENGESAAGELQRALGGAAAVNASLAALGFDGIVDDAASPAALALMLGDLAQGKLLQPSSRAELLDALAAVNASPGRLRAGFPARTRIAHEAGTAGADAVSDAGIVYVNGRMLVVVAMLRGARGSDAQRDAAIASVAQIANDVTALFPTQ